MCASPRRNGNFGVTLSPFCRAKASLFAQHVDICVCLPCPGDCSAQFCVGGTQQSGQHSD